MTDPELDVAPQARDGRNIDEALGVLRGEGSLQKVERLAPEKPFTSSLPVKNSDNTYYGLPALKPPVWKWYVPAYFYVGGLAGASAALGAAALLKPSLADLSRATRFIAAGGAAASGALLIADLGRPERFLYMMRVFRPTSPMNMGTWILSAFSAAAGASILWPKAAIAAGVFGLPLTAYTGVLVANTTVPLWAAMHRTLPPLFVSSAATAAGAALLLLPLRKASHRAARRMTILSTLAELGYGLLVDLEAKQIREVGKPLQEGISGALWKTSKALTLGALATALLGRKRRALQLAAGVLGSLGSLALRFAVMKAGKASALDPHATFVQQLDAAAAT